MAVNHRHDIGAGAVNFAMDEALQIDFAAARGQWVSVKIEFKNIIRGDKGGRQVSGQEKAINRLVVADADMAEGVDDTVIEENMVGQNQILDKRGIGGRRRNRSNPGAGPSPIPHPRNRAS